LKNILLIIGIFGGLCAPGTAVAQLPACKLFSFELAFQPDTLYVTKPRYLSHFNESGYNNQPSFVSDREFLITSNADESLQTDLFLCKLRTRELTNLTSSAGSEYSGKMSGDKQYIYYVCVNDQGDQHLCRSSAKNADQPEIILPRIKNVGYFHLLGLDSVILFRVGEPHELWLYSLNGTTALGLSRNIGRCFAQLNRDEIAYVHKVSPEKWTLRSMNIRLQTSAYLADMPEGVEDFVVLKDGRVLCARGSVLYILNKRGRIMADWEPVFDFGIWDIRKISRMAINESQSTLVLVDETN